MPRDSGYPAGMTLHLIKLCVGVERVEDLEEYWRGQQRRRVHTRQTPKKADELLAGGSLYWVIKGSILCRQPIVAVETVGEGVGARCEIVVELPVVRTHSAPRRPFQGWRYLSPDEAPPDLADADGTLAAPPELARQLRELGAW
jgi:hypothetical protein